MSTVAPNGQIRFLTQVPIDSNYENSIDFLTELEQRTYFLGLQPVHTMIGATRVRDGVISVNMVADNLLHANYLMFQNMNFNNKWFYAFITDIQWLSNDSCEITIKTDVWQTWQFDITFKQCFVEREHVNDDTFGKHTVPEGLEYGEYIVNSKTNMGSSYGFNDCVLVAQVSDLLNDMPSSWENRSRIYGGIPNGCWFIPLYSDSGTPMYTNFTNFVLSYDAENKADAIVGMFIMPKALLGLTNDPIIQDFESVAFPFSAYVPQTSYSAYEIGTYTISKPTAIDGYTPKNNKTLCSPYSYLMISNNGGTDISYAWEEFTGTPSFTERGIPNQGCDIKLTPSNYKKTDLSGGYEWSVSRQKLPTVSWNSNFYLNWVAVNGKYMEVQAGLTGLNWASNMLSGMLTGNVGGMVSSTVGLGQQVAQQAQQVREAKMTPDSARGNTNTGDLNYAVGKNCFSAYKMTIKAEYAKIIDDYFTQFGYKVNSLKVPNITGRKYWNYVKTHGCNITGNVPQSDIEEIKGLFNRGITIWHDSTKFLDYSQNNTILTP